MPSRSVLAIAALLTVVSLTATGSAATPKLPTRAQAGARVTVAVTVKAGSRPLTLVLSRDARRSKDDVVLGALKPPRTTKATVLARRRVTVPAATVAGAYRLLGCTSSARCRTLVRTFTVTARTLTPPPAPTGTTPTTNTSSTTITTPTPAPVPPATGLQISPSPIVLGALSRSYTNDEANAATRLVTVSNLGPGTAPPLTMQTVARQGDTIVASQVNGEAFDGKPACFEGMALPEGKSCGTRISWRPAYVNGGQDMVGSFTIRDRNDGVTVTASAPMSAGYIMRAWIAAGGGIFGSPVQGYYQNGEISLHNVGDLVGGYALEMAGPDAAHFTTDSNYGTCQALPGTGLAPDASCTIRLRFCGATTSTYHATLVVHVGGIAGPVSDQLALAATPGASDPPGADC